MRTNFWKKVLALCLIVSAAGWGKIWAGEMAEEEKMAIPPPAVPGALQEKRMGMGGEMAEQMMSDLKAKDPNKAAELAQLREKDPNAFRIEMRKLMRERFADRMHEPGIKQPGRTGEGPEARAQGPGEKPWMGHGGPEMMREWMKEKQDEYIKWLEKNYPDEATRMKGLKEENPEQYNRALMISGRKFWPIFQASKDNPQLEPVLKEQLTLREKRADLLKQIKATTDEKKKKELTGGLEKIVAQQFDLIVKRKQLGCEDLAKKLVELKKEVDQKKAEIEQWKGKDFKNGQVKKRVNELLNETERFEWDN